MLSADFNQLLSMETDDLPEIRVIHLVGECDSVTASSLGDELNKAVNDGRHVVLDTHLLTYIDSAGVAAIATAQEALAQSRKQLRIVGVHGILGRILRISQLDGQIPRHETVDDAVSGINGAVKETVAPAQAP